MDHFDRTENERRDPPSPTISEEQLAWFSMQTERAVRKALWQYGKRAILGYVLLLAGIVIALLMIESDRDTRRADAAQSRHALVVSGRAVSVSGCNRDFRTTKVLRGVLVASKRFNEQRLHRKEVTLEGFNRANAFYNDQLSRLALPDCRDAEHLLTDDPHEPIPQIPPLFPRG